MCDNSIADGESTPDHVQPAHVEQHRRQDRAQRQTTNQRESATDAAASSATATEPTDGPHAGPRLRTPSGSRRAPRRGRPARATGPTLPRTTATSTRPAPATGSRRTLPGSRRRDGRQPGHGRRRRSTATADAAALLRGHRPLAVRHEERQRPRRTAPLDDRSPIDLGSGHAARSTSTGAEAARAQRVSPATSNNPCKGSVRERSQGLQRHAERDPSGPIKELQISRRHRHRRTYNNVPRCAVGRPARELRRARRARRPPRARAASRPPDRAARLQADRTSPSQKHQLDCDPGRQPPRTTSSPTAATPRYVINTGQDHARRRRRPRDLWATPQPWECVAVQTGTNVNAPVGGPQRAHPLPAAELGRQLPRPNGSNQQPAGSCRTTRPARTGTAGPTGATATSRSRRRSASVAVPGARSARSTRSGSGDGPGASASPSSTSPAGTATATDSTTRARPTATSLTSSPRAPTRTTRARSRAISSSTSLPNTGGAGDAHCDPTTIRGCVAVMTK